MKIKISLSVTFLVIVFRILLDITYIHFVVPVFNDYILDISTFKIFESYFITICLSVLINTWFKELKTPSFIFIYILFLNIILPMLTMYSLSNKPMTFMYMVVFGLLVVMLSVKYIPRVRFAYIVQGKGIMTFLFIAISGFVLASLVFKGGLSRISFNLLSVYETRELYANSSGFLMGYLLPWQAYSINTLLLAYFLYKKKTTPIVLVLLFQVFLYATTGFKSFLFAPILVISIHILFNKMNVKKILPFLVVGAITIVSISFLLFKFTGDFATGSILIRRAFFTPSQLHFIFYDFFNGHPFVMLSNSILSGIINNPYGDSNILYMVSNYYFNKDIGVNVGFMGNAYMNFGFFGIFLFSVFLGLFLKLLDSIAKIIPLSVAVSSIIIPASNLVNSGLLTTLLTHGLLLSCFSLWMLASHLNRSKENQFTQNIEPPKLMSLHHLPKL